MDARPKTRQVNRERKSPPPQPPFPQGPSKSASPAFPPTGGEALVDIDPLGDLIFLNPNGSPINLGPNPLG